MAQRTVCLYKGQYIGIETIYTVVNGKQINIPEKLKELRTKSQNNELFCPCGCGVNLILVAGDKNLREQHFRLKDGENESECHYVTEGKTSVASKISLKCWLDEMLKTDDIETRVPINLVEDTKRKYEFSFLSRTKKTAVNYCYDRVNLSDEKFEILEANSNEIKIVHIVDIANKGNNGQYPEALMKVQKRQGYCLFLDVKDALYESVKMCAAFYAQDIDGIWRELLLSEGGLREYNITTDGITFRGVPLDTLVNERYSDFEYAMMQEKNRREEAQIIYEEQQIKRKEAYERLRLERQEREEEEKRRLEEKRLQKEKEEAERLAEIKRQKENFEKNLKENLQQQETPVYDSRGVRWIKCELCGKIATEKEFISYGGTNHINLGTCKECAGKERKHIPSSDTIKTTYPIKHDLMICPECGGKLRERRGRIGSFIGCSNFPECKYTRNIRRK